MNITSKALVRVCVALLILYPVAAIVVRAYILTDEHQSIMAALFAVNAGAALFAGLIFSLPQFSNHTSGALKLLVTAIGVICVLVSALFWFADEVENVWIRLGLFSPVGLTLILLLSFVDKVNKEGAKHDDE